MAAAMATDPRGSGGGATFLGGAAGDCGSDADNVGSGPPGSLVCETGDAFFGLWAGDGADETGFSAAFAPGIQPLGGVISTMLPHFGHARMVPIADSLRTFSRAWQVVQVIENSVSSTARTQQLEENSLARRVVGGAPSIVVRYSRFLPALGACDSGIVCPEQRKRRMARHDSSNGGASGLDSLGTQ